MPLPNALLLVFMGGLVIGAAANWAAYTWAWRPRPISPWAPPDEKALPRRWSDRLPVVGWIGLRREVELHGRGFWIRPIIVELAVAIGLCWLYWWEVDQQRLLQGQILELMGAPFRAPMQATLATFISHAILIALMSAASLVDIDEKIIPDEITVIGTLVGLALAAAAPLALLPDVELRTASPAVSEQISLPNGALNQGALYVEPVTPNSPNLLPPMLEGAPHWQGLAIALGCLSLWCFALTPRIWRRRRGAIFGMRILLVRVARELRRAPLSWIWLGGTAAIVAIWWIGGAHWIGLYTALVGLVGSGALIWAVRIVGSAALGREAMGFGDVTLMMMIGAFLGWQAGIFIFFVAPFAGLIGCVPQLIFRRGDMIPYGPFLCLGAVVVMVFWGEIWQVDPPGQKGLFLWWWLVPAVLGVCIVLLGGMLAVWARIRSSEGALD